jgi:hypothetical protein
MSDVDVDGVPHPAPAPHFCRTSCDSPRTPAEPGPETFATVLSPWFPAQQSAHWQSALQDSQTT